MDISIHATCTDCKQDVYQQAVYMSHNAEMKSAFERLLKAAEMLKGWKGNAEIAAGLTRYGYEVSNQTVTNWKNRGVSAEGILNASRIIGCRSVWIETGIGPMEDMVEPITLTGIPVIEWETADDLPTDQFTIVPRYDLHVAAGNGHVVYEELELAQGQSYRADYLRRKGLRWKNLFCVYARGDSMEPTIGSGDALLIDRSQTDIQDRGVYVIRYGNEIRVKRLYRRPDGGLRIISDNPQYPEEVITAAEMSHIDIVGRVVDRAGGV